MLTTLFRKNKNIGVQILPPVHTYTTSDVHARAMRFNHHPLYLYIKYFTMEHQLIFDCCRIHNIKCLLPKLFTLILKQQGWITQIMMVFKSSALPLVVVSRALWIMIIKRNPPMRIRLDCIEIRGGGGLVTAQFHPPPNFRVTETTSYIFS